jgi:hypothetical protein
LLAPTAGSTVQGNTLIDARAPVGISRKEPTRRDPNDGSCTASRTPTPAGRRCPPIAEIAGPLHSSRQIPLADRLPHGSNFSFPVPLFRDRYNRRRSLPSGEVLEPSQKLNYATLE